MGTYYEVACQLEWVLKAKDTDMLIEIVQKMLESTEEIGSFSQAELYEHMTFKKADETLGKELKVSLINQPLKDEALAWLKDDIRWKKILELR